MEEEVVKKSYSISRNESRHKSIKQTNDAAPKAHGIP
jgi:hypothetical protein